MELRRLRYLIALAEEEHFGHAAARLHIAQPTLSQEIRKLESDLGLALFDRGPRGATPTEHGRVLLGLARATLQAADDLTATAGSLRRAARNELRVGFVAATAPPFLPEVVRAWRIQHPDSRLDLVEYGVDEPAAGLRDGSVDVALIWPPVSARDVVSRELLSIPRVAVLPSGHPLADRAEIGIDDLSDDACVSIASDDPEWSDFWLAEPERLKPAIRGARAKSLDGVLAVIAAGEGVGLAPDVVAASFRRPELAFVPVRDIAPAALHVAWPGSRPLSALTRSFARSCLAAAGHPR